MKPGSRPSRALAPLANTLRIRTIRLRGEGAHEAETAPLAETEFAVPGMVCEGCADKISAALSPIAGVCEVKSQILLKRVRVRYEPGEIRFGHSRARPSRGRSLTF